MPVRGIDCYILTDMTIVKRGVKRVKRVIRRWAKTATTTNMR